MLVGTVKSREDVLKQFELEGVTVKEWSNTHDFNPVNVYAVLAGRTRGRRGEAHRIAMELGLKPRVSEAALGENRNETSGEED